MYEYRAKIVDVYDGDTFTFYVDLGFDVWVKSKLRLYGVDTPELRGSDKEMGIIVRDYVKELILNKLVTIRVHKKGKYGRYVANVFFQEEPSKSWVGLSKDLIDKKLAYQVDYD